MTLHLIPYHCWFMLQRNGDDPGVSHMVGSSHVPVRDPIPSQDITGELGRSYTGGPSIYMMVSFSKFPLSVTSYI